MSDPICSSNNACFILFWRTTGGSQGRLGGDTGGSLPGQFDIGKTAGALEQRHWYVKNVSHSNFQNVGYNRIDMEVSMNSING